MKSISQFHPLWIILFLFTLASCQPDIDDPNIDPDPSNFDSTQLVKDIKLIFHDSNGIPDSITETYNYDTINRKIIATWTTTPSSDLNGYSVEYSYTLNHLLKSIVHTYPSGHTPVSWDQTNVSIEYDDQNIIKKIVFNYISRPSFTINYTKIVGSTGYRLYWENTGVWLSSIYKNTSFYNENNKFIRYQQDIVAIDPNGNRTDSSFQYIDTLLYTSAGDLQKVYRSYNAIPGPPPPQILYYEFGQHYDKGEQLSRQRQLLYKGISNIQYDLNEQDWCVFSVVNLFYDVYGPSQFSRFPCKTSMFDYNGSAAQNITHDVSFDSINRLVSYSGYTYGNPEPEGRIVWKLTYYK